MPPLEKALYARLIGDDTLASLLASFGDTPAVFERQAPEDTDSGWSGAQYPRVIYLVDRTPDPERGMDGTLNLLIFATPEEAPEPIEAAVASLMDGGVLKDGDTPVAFVKTSVTPFTAEYAGGDELMTGLEVTYGFVGFPGETTYDPDPVATLSAWTEDTLSDVQVDPSTWAPTDDNPGVWWRFTGLSMVDRDPQKTTFDASIVGHVLSPTRTGRVPLVREITERLAQLRVGDLLYLSDDSPLEVRSVMGDPPADPLRVGQVRLVVRYALLVPRTAFDPLRHVVMSGDAEGHVP
jgi:hypothetical protein